MSFPRSLEGLLEQASESWPEAPAVDDGSVAWDYSELCARARCLAAGLVRLGAGAGDRVAVLAHNRADTVALYFAVGYLDAVLMPLNQRLKTRELDWILRHCPPRVICVDAGYVDVVDATVRELVPEDGRLEWGSAREGWRTVDSLIRGVEWTGRTGSTDPDRIAIQMYTSGTTGHPKGALLTHGNVLALTEAWLIDMHLDPGRSRFLQVTPLFHVGGMLMVMSTVASGSRMRLLPEFDPLAAIDLLQVERITHTLMVPAMIQWCLLEPGIRGRSFPDLQHMVYGASSMPAAVLERAMQVFDCDLLQGYGLTESAGVLLVLRPEDHRWPAGEELPSRLGSAGRAVGCSEVRVVNEAREEVGPGDVGEIVARGANLTPGYYADPEASARAIRDGWFHTGDLGRVDAQGFIYIVDRVKDMLLVGGENVYPREVEDVLMEHSAVADVAVFGIPHEVWGEQVHALVVFVEGAPPPGRRALIRHCRKSLAGFKCPTEVEQREELPRNAAGKLEKRALREPYWKGLDRRV